VIAVILSGCGKIDPKIYSQDGPVTDGDILIESTIGDAKSLNPALVDEVTGGDIDDLVFNGLARFKDNLEPEPCLAEKWTVSKDGKVITYYLRKGVKFHDGVEFTAQDVQFTYKVYTDPKTNTPYGNRYQDIQSVQILDPYTVKVTYKQPFASALTSTFDYILPKHLLEGKDINTCDFNRHPVGTGPYRFVEWKTDQKIVLERNPDFWEGTPHIQKYVLRIVPDQSTEFLELLNGGVDTIGGWSHGTMTAEQYARQIDTPKFKDYYNPYLVNELVYSYIGWNNKSPLFNDKRVRQALTRSLDREVMLKNVVYGLGTLATGPFAAHPWANDPTIKPIPYDPESAKKLFGEAGWKKASDGLLHKTIDGKDTPFKFTLLINQGNVGRERVATIVQQQLKQMGIEVEVKILEWTTHLSQNINKRKYEAYIMSWSLTPQLDE
jgi:peptide/nickel transport system substrate-binding protein